MYEMSRPESAGLCGERLERVRTWMRRYVDSGKAPGAAALAARRGRVVFCEAMGCADPSTGEPMTTNSIFHLHSMTAPVTSAAVMMLYEEGLLHLDDPVAEFIPSFGDARVHAPAGGSEPGGEPAREPITIHHLLTHTSGLTRGFGEKGPIPDLYQKYKTDFFIHDGLLSDVVDRLAGIPLAFHPGRGWSPGVSMDVLGRVVEVVSGRPLDEFFQERILGPLAMTDTGFMIPTSARDRFVPPYTPVDGRGMDGAEAPSCPAPLTGEVITLSGGRGLVSTLTDYYRFTELLRLKGTLGGAHLLGRKTVEYMTRNHLPRDPAEMETAALAPRPSAGIGFGLGLYVMVDPVKARIMGTPGEYASGGNAGVAFWTDPVEDMTVIFLSQALPPVGRSMVRELRVLMYQAIID